MSENKYNTNLASEYYVISMLHRLGASAVLTVGNKKSVDILIFKNHDLIQIDVKGIAGKTLWPLDNFRGAVKNRFLILVSYLGKIKNHDLSPEVYIIRSDKVEKFIYKNPKGNRKGIQLSEMRKNGIKYRNAWHFFLN
ncbi:MAG: hypothetical protein KGQ80_09145 [Bacteroidetes bacterium]|nr:hypothetical protein [Bacteroidota bacterium]